MSHFVGFSKQPVSWQTIRTERSDPCATNTHNTSRQEAITAGGYKLFQNEGSLATAKLYNEDLGSLDQRGILPENRKVDRPLPSLIPRTRGLPTPQK